MRKLTIAVFVAFALAPRWTHAAIYDIDTNHSSVMFRVRHLAGHVTGQFDKFQGAFTYEPGHVETWKASATIDAASVDTRVTPRDKHLRSADFFDVEKFPTLVFVSAAANGIKGSHAKLHGDLTIHGVTKPVVLDLEIEGVEKDAGGNNRADFTATTRINRQDFGLTWNNILETGGVLVGDDVDITIEAEGIQRP